MKSLSKLFACFSKPLPNASSSAETPLLKFPEFKQTVQGFAEIVEINDLVEGKTYFSATADRFLLTTSVEVVYEMNDTESISDIRSRQWFDFPKATAFTYDNASTIVRNMDIPNGMEGISGWNACEESVQQVLLKKLEDGQEDPMLAAIVVIINDLINKGKNKHRSFTLSLHIRKATKVQPHEYNVLASYKKAKTIQISLENIVKFHARFNFPCLSRDKWILKIKDTLAESGVRDLDKQTLNKLADKVNNMIEEKSSVNQCIICLEEIEFESPFKILFCSHIFHRDCINNWLRQSEKCPICNGELLAEDR